MGDDAPGQGEVQKVTIEVCGPLDQEEFNKFKAAMRECLKKFKKKPYKARVVSITIEPK